MAKFVFYHDYIDEVIEKLSAMKTSNCPDSEGMTELRQAYNAALDRLRILESKLYQIFNEK